MWCSKICQCQSQANKKELTKYQSDCDFNAYPCPTVKNWTSYEIKWFRLSTKISYFYPYNLTHSAIVIKQIFRSVSFSHSYRKGDTEVRKQPLPRYLQHNRLPAWTWQCVWTCGTEIYQCQSLLSSTDQPQPAIQTLHFLSPMCTTSPAWATSTHPLTLLFHVPGRHLCFQLHQSHQYEVKDIWRLWYPLQKYTSWFTSGLRRETRE